MEFLWRRRHQRSSRTPSRRNEAGRSTTTTKTTTGGTTQQQQALNSVPTGLPLRESSHPGFLSKYSRFWWSGGDSGGWEVFLWPCDAPGKGGSFFEAARKNPGSRASTRNLAEQPGVYEFALCKTYGGPRYKVYIGESSNVHRRHHLEYSGPQGGHLRNFFEDALADGCIIVRRVKYLARKDQAVAWEAAFLSRYDYAWNSRQNGACRTIQLRQRCCCCCAHTVVRRVSR